MKVFFFRGLKPRVNLSCIFSIIIFICLFSTNTFAVDIFSYQLLAGQHIDVGEVQIWNDDEFLYVKYMTTDNWKMLETKMQFAL
jgi:hypothetical protein